MDFFKNNLSIVRNTRIYIMCHPS